MTRKDNGVKHDSQKKCTDSVDDFTTGYKPERTEPQKFAEAYFGADGRLRLVADPLGEWIESDVTVEVLA